MVPYTTVSSSRTGVPLLIFICLTVPSRASYKPWGVRCYFNPGLLLFLQTFQKPLNFIENMYGCFVCIHRQILLYFLFALRKCLLPRLPEEPDSKTNHPSNMVCGSLADLAVQVPCHPGFFVLFCSFVFNWNLPQILFGIR